MIWSIAFVFALGVWKFRANTKEIQKDFQSKRAKTLKYKKFRAKGITFIHKCINKIKIFKMSLEVNEEYSVTYPDFGSSAALSISVFQGLTLSCYHL